MRISLLRLGQFSAFLPPAENGRTGTCLLRCGHGVLRSAQVSTSEQNGKSDTRSPIEEGAKCDSRQSERQKRSRLRSMRLRVVMSGHNTVANFAMPSSGIGKPRSRPSAYRPWTWLNVKCLSATRFKLATFSRQKSAHRLQVLVRFTIL